MNKLKKWSVWLLLIVTTLTFLYPDLMQWKLKKEAESSLGINENIHEEMISYNERLRLEGQNLTDCWSDGQSSVSVSVDEMKAPEETTLPEEIQMETKPSVQPAGVIGQIRIPAMEVTLPLYYGASNENLAKGAAVLAETSMPIGGESTNCVIAGHRGYGGLLYFRKIDELKAGDVVEIVNSQETLEYIVESMEIIIPTDLTCLEIQEGRDMVTLISCHPYMGNGRFRYVVYCCRNGTPSAEDPTTATTGNTLEEMVPVETVAPSVHIQEDEALLRELRQVEENVPLTFLWEDQIRQVLYIVFAAVWLIMIGGTVRNGMKK